jgi:hypothetical protein
MEKSFCGASICVSFPQPDCPSGEITVFGEFHGQHYQSFQLGQAIPRTISELHIPATTISAVNNGRLRAVLKPKRKWTYANITKDTSEHFFSIYLVISGRVTDVVTSAKFDVTPIWLEQKKQRKRISPPQTTRKANSGANHTFLYRPLGPPPSMLFAPLDSDKVQGFHDMLRVVFRGLAPAQRKGM